LRFEKILKGRVGYRTQASCGSTFRIHGKWQFRSRGQNKGGKKPKTYMWNRRSKEGTLKWGGSAAAKQLGKHFGWAVLSRGKRMSKRIQKKGKTKGPSP